MSRNIFVTAVLAVSLLSACGGGGSGEILQLTPVSFSDATITQFRPYAPGEYVIRSRVELQTAWAANPFSVFPIGIVTAEPVFPNYDFQSSMLVGISLGVGKWCFAPQIVRVSMVGANLDIEYRVPTTSTLACLRDGPLISFALVPKFAGSATFRLIGS
jgi:hypothetical protein